MKWIIWPNAAVPVSVLYLYQVLHLYHGCTCISAVPVSQLYLYQCYTCISTVPVSVLYLYQCYTCISTVPVSVLYLYHCCTCITAVPVSQLYLYQCCTCMCCPCRRHWLHSWHWTCFNSARLIVHDSAVHRAWNRRHSFSLDTSHV